MLSAVAIGVGLLVNAVTFAYFYGRLSMRVDGHDERLTRIENWQDSRSSERGKGMNA